MKTHYEYLLWGTHPCAWCGAETGHRGLGSMHIPKNITKVKSEVTCKKCLKGISKMK